MRRPERAGEGELFVREIDGDDLASAGELCAEDRAQADAAEADHRDRCAGLDPGRVDDRADAGQHRAAEQSRKLERQIGIDLDAGFARDHRVVGEGRDAEMMIDRLAAEGQPLRAAEERAGAIGPRAGFAERRTSGGARAAAAAARHEDEHHMIADRKIANALAQRLDDPCRLMAERHRHWARPRAVDDGEVRMTETGGFDANQNLAAAGRREIEIDDVERARRGVGGRKPALGEEGGFDAHRRSLEAQERQDASHSPSNCHACGKRASRDRRMTTAQPGATCYPRSSFRWTACQADAVALARTGARAT